MTQKVVKSYKVFFDSKVKTRVLTKSKKDLIFNISKYFKSCTNYIFKTNHEGYNSWKGMKKVDYDFVRKLYESEFNKVVSAPFSQNLFKFANNKYNHTKKAFYSQFIQDKVNKNNKKVESLNKINKDNSQFKKRNKKVFFKKPYSEEFLEFPLDNRMLKSAGKLGFIKDEKVKNLYWLSIINPFKSTKYKKNLNIPLKLYPEILNLLDKGYKYSFALHNDYVKITFSYEIDDNEFKKEVKKLDKVAIDFGKYISSYDGKASEQHDLSKMYNKINKLLKEAGQFQKRLQILKDEKKFDEEYNEIKKDLKGLFKRIKAIRKSTYGQLKNYYSNNYERIILEDLTFTQIEKKTTTNGLSKAYKGKKFNKILRIMGRGEWDKVFETMVGNQVEKRDARYSSQKCSFCGEISRKYRKGRHFKCLFCGHNDDADINAAKNLYQASLNL